MDAAEPGSPPVPESRKRYSDIFRSLDNLEISLGNVTLEMLAGELELSEDPESDKALPGTATNESSPWGAPSTEPPVPLSGEELDLRLIRTKGGVDAALDYAKTWGRYAKELLAWMEKRVSLELEFVKSVMKIAEAGKVSIHQQSHMPLQYIYTLFLEHDLSLGTLALETAAQQKRDYSQPLAAKRTEIEKWRKEFKEQWLKEQKRMNEAVQALRRAQLQYVQRCEELRARSQAPDDPTPQASPGPSKQQERRRRSREEAQAKAQEAEALYQACVREANARQQDLEATKQRIVSHVRKLVLQGDEVLRRVTLGLFTLRGAQAQQGPRAFAALAECCAPFEPGQRYQEYVRALRPEAPPPPPPVFTFQEFVPSTTSSPVDGRKLSGGPPPLRLEEGAAEQGSWRDAGTPGPNPAGDGDSESRSLDSPTSSPGAGARRLVKVPSTGTESSDDFEEREPDLGDGLENGQGSPFRKWTLSGAAQTHRLRRLRGPAKCRECDTFMVSGIECEQCFLTCHKRCLETLLILCGHRRLPPRTALFGVDFLQFPRDFPEEVPFLVTRCTAEMEQRALSVQGIYRVSGSRVRMERLCQAFENGRALVDLSGHSPHDISGVLKRFLQELTEPVVPFHLYDAFMSLAKTLRADPGSDPATPVPNPDAIRSLKELLLLLPDSNYNTLRHLVAHLVRVAAQFTENKMSANNLGIVFGPTLLRAPASPGAASVACLLDSGHQAQLVEFLILHYEHIFGLDELPPDPGPLTHLSLEPLTSDHSPNTSADLHSAPEMCPEAVDAEAPAPQPDQTEEEEDASAPEEAMSGPEDLLLGTQSRGHFSRQPVKYPRGGTRPVTPQLSSLATSKLCEEESGLPAPRGSLQRRRATASSPDGSPLRRAPLSKHFEITQETARLLAKMPGDAVCEATHRPDTQAVEEVDDRL